MTLSQGTASAPRAGGAGDAALDAPATSHPVPKTQASVSAGLGFGGHCANIIVTACMGTATLLMGIAAATLAIRAGAVGIPVLLVITDLSADTAVGTASGASPALLWMGSAWHVTLAGTVPSVRSCACLDTMGRTVHRCVPAAEKGRPVIQRQGLA